MNEKPDNDNIANEIDKFCVNNAKIYKPSSKCVRLQVTGEITWGGRLNPCLIRIYTPSLVAFYWRF